MFPKHGNPGPTGTDFKKNCCKNKKSPAAVQCPELARPERFELPTFWFVARHSNQLTYGRVYSEILLAEREGFEPSKGL